MSKEMAGYPLWDTVEDAFHGGGEFTKEAAPYRVHPMQHGLQKEQVDELVADTGAGGAVINASWDDGWNFNPQSLQNLRDTAYAMRDRGLRSWLYDEKVYPSGWAGGYIMKDGARHIAKNIGVSILEGNGAGTQTISLPKDGLSFLYVAAYNMADDGCDYENPKEWVVCRREVSGETPEGDWQVLAFYIRWCNVWPYAFADTISPPIGPREHLNFLEREAVATFIEGALQPVADTIPDFNECFDAIFTDEPALQSIYIFGPKNVPSFASVPFGSELFELFEKTNGYDLRKVLPYLFFGNTVKARTVRVQYYRTVAELMRKNFTGQMAEWCHDHGVKFSGHMHAEEHLFYHVGNYGDYMDVMALQDWTGFDMLEAWPGYYWTKGEGANSTGGAFLAAKYAGSVSRGNGHNTTMVELCPCGHDKLMLKDQPTIHDSFMQLTTFVTFGGATHINAYGYAYNHIQENFHKWNRYTGRLCAVLRDSVSDAKIGVYYPVADTQAAMYAPNTKLDDLSDRCKVINNYIESLVYNLYLNRHDFNFITERMVNNSQSDNGTITIGNTAYSVILLPDCDIVPLSVMKALKTFADQGGHVHFLDRLPTMGITMDEHDEVARLALEISGGKVDELRPDNLAMNAKVTATSTGDAYDVCNVTNGTIDTAFSWDGWRSESVPAELTLESKEPTAFNRIDVYTKAEHAQRQYTVFCEQQGEWTKLAEVQDNSYFHLVHEFPLITASRLKFVFEDGCEAQPDIAGVNAIEVCRICKREEANDLMTRLHTEVNDSLIIHESDSVFVSRYRRNDTSFYYIINPSDKTDHIRLSDKDNRLLRLYEADSGCITDGKELTFELAPGRGAFVEYR